MKVIWYPKKGAQVEQQRDLLYKTSNRLRCANLEEVFQEELGVSTEIRFRCGWRDLFSGKGEIQIFQKGNPWARAWQIRKKLRPSAISVVDLCDPVPPEQARYLSRSCQLIITSSTELADLIRPWCECPVVCVADHHEADPDHQKIHEAGETLDVRWYGILPGYEDHVKPLRKILDVDWVDFHWGSNGDGHEDEGFSAPDFHMSRKDAWTRPGSWQEFVREADVGLVPIAEDAIKASHKVLNFMACGIPVVCSPTKAHKEILEHGVEGFFASSPEEWEHALQQLRDSSLRRTMGQAARDRVLKPYSCESKAREYRDVLKRLIDEQN